MHTYACVLYLLIIVAILLFSGHRVLAIQLHALQPFSSVLFLLKVYAGCYFLCKLNKSWLFIRSDYRTWLSSAVKLKVKPAVAAIELHWVSNVKSKGSLTVIKRSLSSERKLHWVLPPGQWNSTLVLYTWFLSHKRRGNIVVLNKQL